MNKKGCEPIPVVLPPIEEQEKIIINIKSISSRITSEKSFLMKLEKQKSGLMHDLLTGKVPVTVDAAAPEAAHV